MLKLLSPEKIILPRNYEYLPHHVLLLFYPLAQPVNNDKSLRKEWFSLAIGLVRGHSPSKFLNQLFYFHSVFRKTQLLHGNL
jgi:hypothetical protein